MVMDLTPSPQCVGREFVRQYYTLLNKAPTHVHRFYNNNSSFVHGGLNEFNRGEATMEPAVGQKQIHRCIQQLDFRDCHAKITQVDSQATLGNGVVVQVTGELSNGGQPMRRFTQTFVLGAQSPKQYYVHNDIFRYQDLVFGDDEPDQEQNPFDHEEEEPDLPQPQDIPPQIEQAQYYPSAPPMPTMNGGAPPEEPRVNPPAPTPPPAAPTPSPTPPAPLPVAQPAYIVNMEPPQPRAIPQEQDWSQEVNQEEEEGGEEEKPEAADEWQDVPETPPASQPPPPTAQQSPPPAEPVSLSNEPKTYASTLVKSGGGVSNFNTSPNAPKSPPSPPPTYTRLESRNNETNAQRMRGGGRGGPGPNVRGMGGGRGDGRSPSSRPSIAQDDYPRSDYGGSRDQQGRDSDQASVEGGAGMGERRRPPNSYSDDQQLFLGNLPLHASEADLRDLFRQFGNIVDLRIMSKSNMKSQNGNKVPNYGFIIFESVEHVQATLGARPIFFPGDPSVKLNVEEKKTKPRMDGGGGGGRGGGPRPQPMGGLPRGGMSRGGQRGGFTRGARPAGFTQRGGPR